MFTKIYLDQNGDMEKERGLVAFAKQRQSIMHDLMKFNSLQQEQHRCELIDGSIIKIKSCFGQDRIEIYSPLPDTMEMREEYLMVTGYYLPTKNPAWTFIWDVARNDYATDAYTNDGVVSPSEYPVEGYEVFSPWASGRIYSSTGIGYPDSNNTYYAPNNYRVGDIVYVAGTPGAFTTVASISGERLTVTDISKLGSSYCYVAVAMPMRGTEVEWWSYEPGPWPSGGFHHVVDWRSYYLKPEFTGLEFETGPIWQYNCWWSFILSSLFQIRHITSDVNEVLPTDGSSYFIYTLMREHADYDATGGTITNEFRWTYRTRVSDGSVIPGHEIVTVYNGNDQAPVVPDGDTGDAGEFTCESTEVIEAPNPFVDEIIYQNHVGWCIMPNVYSSAEGSFTRRSAQYDVQFYVYNGWEENVYAQCRRHNNLYSSVSTTRSAELEAAIKKLIGVVEDAIEETGIPYGVTVEGKYYSEKRFNL